MFFFFFFFFFFKFYDNFGKELRARTTDQTETILVPHAGISLFFMKRLVISFYQNNVLCLIYACLYKNIGVKKTLTKSHLLLLDSNP